MIYLDALSALGAALFGLTVSQAVTDATGGLLPGWISVLMGPLGTLACLIIAARWLAAKTDATEKRAEELTKAHAEKLEGLTHAAMKVTDRVSTSLDALVEELRTRPCATTLPPRRLPHEID